MLLCFVAMYSSEAKETRNCIECYNSNFNCFDLYNDFIGISLYLVFKVGLFYIHNKAYSGTMSLPTEGKCIKILVSE